MYVRSVRQLPYEWGYDGTIPIHLTSGTKNADAILDFLVLKGVKILTDSLNTWKSLADNFR